MIGTPPRPLHAYAAYFLMLLLGLLLLLAGEALGGWAAAIGRVGGIQLAALLAVAIVIPLGALPLRQSLRLDPVSGRGLLAALLIGLGLSLLVSATLARLYGLGEAEEHARQVEQVLRETARSLGPVVLVLIIIALAPLAEELLFRGLMLSGFRARYPVWLAVLVSTLLFAILHAHPVHSSITAVLGLSCALLVIRLGSIWPAVVLHSAYNATALGLDRLEVRDFLPLWTIAPALAIMALGIFLIRRSTRDAG